ncbi:hypothetical protein SAMN05661093_01189 [Kibdelosporangium aridum]|uniref:Uncharacterized protein n=1 Tax=Kibdelosporangium aridum TaxID=2030 RepID=A0A1Y5X1W9_KIBAR|nr:hypothetical protein SAMN05661093_01189 [Kibdelosporangium aridum]
MVDILNSVDSPAAINELVGIIRSPRRRMTQDRQFATVIELRKRNQLFGAERTSGTWLIIRTGPEYPTGVCDCSTYPSGWSFLGQSRCLVSPDRDLRL